LRQKSGLSSKKIRSKLLVNNKYGSVVLEEIVYTTALIEDISIRDAIEHYYPNSG